MQASSDRYRLGLRLRMFEVAWEGAKPAQKKRALPSVQQAVFSFFAGSPAAAAAALDGARAALRERPPTEAEAILGCLTVDAPRFLLPGTPKIELTIERLYGDRELPKGVSVEVSLNGPKADVVARAQAVVTALPATLTLPVPPVKAEIDATLSVRFLLDKKPVFAEERTLSLLSSEPVKLARVPHPLAAESLRLYNALLAGEQPETEIPAARLRRQIIAADTARPLWGAGQPGEFWLSLNDVPIRLLAPTAARSRKPLPLVLALHGAGGSENLFFDGYGNGKIKTLCEKRGWLLLATRSGQGLRDLDGVLKSLDDLYPIDRKRVFLVGHSMGAAMACSLVERLPEKTFAALACLGGGGVLTKKLPTFLGLGEQDFGAQMAQRMPVRPKIYPNAEHLTVVQDALSDVFSFFFAVTQVGSSAERRAP